jgi:hypothetical protein
LVMPMPASVDGRDTGLGQRFRAVASWLDHISRGSCSTQPGCGKIWRNSRCALATIRPCVSNTMLRELEVP